MKLLKTWVDSVKEAGDKFAKAIENAAEKVSKAVTTGSLAGATAYVLKNTNLPPIAKAAVVESSAAAGSIISSTSSVFENSNSSTSTSTTSKNEVSKDIYSINDVSPSSPSSPLEDLNFFYETGNHLHNILLNLLGLSIINLFHIYLLILYLFYIFIYNKYDLNWLKNLIPHNIIVRLKSLSEKWAKGNYVFIFCLMIIILIVSFYTVYFQYKLFLNLDNLVELYLKFNK